jgi:predicted transcriptional regulator
MRALTVRQPWAGLIVAGVKAVENRTWRPPADVIGERIAIHAGRHAVDACSYGVDTSARGAIVGTVRIVDVVRDAESVWAQPDCWHWMLDEASALTVPVPAKGRLGLWEVPDNILEAVAPA